MNKKNKIVPYIFILTVLMGIGFLIFNESGFIKYMKLKGEVKELHDEVSRKKSENKNREAEIDSLQKKIPTKIEQTAREKYGMMKKGEKIIKIEEK